MLKVGLVVCAGAALLWTAARKPVLVGKLAHRNGKNFKANVIRLKL